MDNKREVMYSMQFYVILASWDDVLYKLEAWSKNYYLAKMYYQQFNEKYSDALFYTYECKSVTEFSVIMKNEVDASVDLIVNSNLRIATSGDDKLSVIYKDMYTEFFNIELMNKSTKHDILSMVGGFALSTVPLTVYLVSDTANAFITEILFKLYQYSKVSNPSAHLDMVYLWYSIVNTNGVSIISSIELPKNLVFVK